jgi:hypothetical protein
MNMNNPREKPDRNIFSYILLRVRITACDNIPERQRPQSQQVHRCADIFHGQLPPRAQAFFFQNPDVVRSDCHDIQPESDRQKHAILG